MSNRERLIQLLTMQVIDGLLTEEEAGLILDEYDETGELPEGWQLPLPLEEAIPVDLQALVEDTLFAYRNVIAASPDRAQDEFAGMVSVLTMSSVAIWHSDMRDILIDYLVEQAQTGAQRVLDDDEVFELTGLVAVQLAFLARFADAVATNRQSQGQIAERSTLYSGEGRALWYKQNGVTNAQYGWVVDYLAIDDRYTCGPCSEAEARGPYLPDDASAPLPGRICLGRGACRCVRQLRYDPATYLRLGGRSA